MEALIAHIIAFVLLGMVGLLLFGQLFGALLGGLTVLCTTAYRLAIRIGLALSKPLH